MEAIDFLKNKKRQFFKIVKKFKKWDQSKF